jgi:hypothetical protein
MATFADLYNSIGGAEYGSNIQPSAVPPMDFGGLLFGGMDGGLNDYLSEAQRQAMQRQAMLSAAAALLKSSGRSTTKTSLGQALGQGLEAGAAGYQQAQQSAIAQLMTKQKLDEYKLAQDQRRRLEQIFGAQAPTAGMPMTPEQALAAPVGQVGPTAERAAMIGQIPESVAMSPEDIRYDQFMKASQLFASDPVKSKAYIDMAMAIKPKTEVTGDVFTAKDGRQYQRTKTGQFVPVPTGIEFAQETVGEPFKAADGKTYLRTKTGGFVEAPQAIMAKPIGTPQQVMGTDGKPTLVQMYDDGTYKPITGVSPLIPPEKVDTGGGIRFVDPYAIKPGTMFPKTLAPQVVGSPEGGYYAIGGGGGRGGVPAAPTTAPATQAPTAFPTRGSRAPAAAPVAPAAAVPQPLIPGTGKAFANEKDLRTEFSAQVKPYTELAQAFRKVEAAALNPSAAGDISLVYGYMKILDPGSTVMQGEQATAQNAGSVPDSVRAMYNKALTGESLAPTIRQDFYAQARNIIESQRELSSDLINRYTVVAKEYKLNPNQIVYDPFKRIKTPAQVAAEAATNQNRPQTNSTYTNQYGLTPRNN